MLGLKELIERTFAFFKADFSKVDVVSCNYRLSKIEKHNGMGAA